MADTLADILNSVTADPQNATPALSVLPPWAQRLANAVPHVATGVFDAATAGPVRRDVQNLIQGDPSMQNTREYAGQISRLPADVVSGTIGLPNVPDAIAQLTTRNNTNWYSRNIGHNDTLNDASIAVHDAGQRVGEAIAGKPLGDELLTGNVNEIGSNWTRLLAGAALPIPGSWQAKMASGLQKVSAGSAVADKAINATANVLSALSPLALNPKAAAISVGVAGTLAPTIEAAIGAHDEAVAQNKAGSEFAKGALDISAEGAKEVREATTQRTIQHASMLPSIISSGDDTTDAIAGAGLLGLAAFAQMKFNIGGRILAGTKKAVTSYDPANPLDKTNMGTWDLIQQQVVNRNQTSETAFRKVLESQGAPNIDDRVTQFKESSAMRTGASVDTRMKSVYNDGTLPDSRHSMAPVSDYYTRWGQLDDAQKGKLDAGIIARREDDTRRINGKAFDLYNTPDADIKAYIHAAQSDPVTKQLMDDYFAMTHVLGSYMEEQKRFTAAEIAQFRNKNPNYAATTITDPSGKWLSERNPKQFQGLETLEEMGSPVKLFPQYLDEVVRSTEGKKIQRDFFNEMMQAKGRADPYAMNMIGRTLTDAPPKDSAGRFVHWRNGRGESRWTEVMDAAVRNSIGDATNPTALQLHKGFSDATRWYEGGAVGASAAATGSVFAPKSYLYARTFGSALRPAGIATSPLDAAMQKFTQAAFSKKIGIPEPFTAMPMDAWNAMNGVYAVLVQRGAVALRSSVIRQGPLARSLDAILPKVPVGPNTAQAAADGLATLYKRTGAHELQQRGLLGPGTFASVDPALSYRNAESVLRANGLIGKTGEAMTFVNDILHGITSAPAVTTEQLNRNAPKANVSHAIRTMSGDPGASGAFRNTKLLTPGVVNTIPWGNIYLQSGFRLINGFKKNPTGAVAGIMSTAVMPEVLSALWNGSQGPEYADYAYNMRTPDQQASSVYIAVPGRPPSEGIEIPIDPWLRPFKHMGSILATSYLGLLDGSLFKPDNEVMLKSIQDAVKHRQLGFGPGTIPSSLIAQTIMPPVPGPLVALAGMNGIQMRGWDEMRPQNDKNTSGFTEGGGPRGSMFLDKFGPAHLDDLMRGIAAQAGANVYTMLNDTLTRRFSEELGRNETNQSLPESIKQGVAGNYAQKLKDSGRMLGTGSLFDSALAITPSLESSGVLVTEKLAGLKKISDAFNASTLPGGTPQTVVGDKKRGFQDYIGVQPIQSGDPTMDVIGREATRISQELSTAYAGAKKDLYEQRQSIANSSKFSPQLKRYMMNEVADQIIQMDRRMLTDIERHEAVISQQIGIPVKFDKMNLNQGSKQFK